MVILQILGIHPIKLGGFEDYILNFAKTTKERGYRTVFVFEGEPHEYIKMKLNQYDCPYCIHETRKGIYAFIRFLGFLTQIIRKYRPSIIQGQFHPQSHFATIAGLLTRTPAFITIHSTSSQNSKPVGISNIVKANVSSILSRKVIAVSYAVMKDLIVNLHTSPKNIIVLHNGVNLEKYNPMENDFSLHREIGISNTSKIVLTVAAARPEKGLEYLIRAIPDITSINTDTHFVFCGGGPLENELINLASTLGVREHVHFLGVRDDVPDLLNCAYILVLPSLAEPFGLAVVEAMAMTKAVIATNVDGIPEMVQDGITGILVNPGNSNDLSASVNHLLKNEEKTRLMGIEGRMRAELDFNLDNRVLKEIQLYENYTNKCKV